MSYSEPSAPPGEHHAEAGSGKPLPDQTDPATKQFWAAVNDHQLVIQRCESCRRFYHPPVGLCWDCLSDDLRFTEVSGRGHVYSFTVVKDQRLPAFDDLTPFVVASVELDDAPGVFLRSNVPGVAIDAVSSGMAVAVEYEELAPGISLPQFSPAHD